VGSLVALNARGALVADIATEAELDVLRGVGMRVERLRHALNAAGNNVLVNDKGALLHPEFDPETARRVADLFGVEAKRGAIAETSTVGMAAVATNKGLLVHPKASEAQRATLESLFGVESQAGTINHGVPSVGAGVVANSKGALLGQASTGLELGRAEDALRLY
jgi:translation initiation factor 6